MDNNQKQFGLNRAPTGPVMMNQIPNPMRVSTMASIASPGGQRINRTQTITSIHTAMPMAQQQQHLSPTGLSPSSVQRQQTFASIPEPKGDINQIDEQGPTEDYIDQRGSRITNQLHTAKIIEWDDLTYAEHTEATYLEIFHYPTAESRIFQGSLDDSNYEDWLMQGVLINKGELPTSGCRLIMTPRPQYGIAYLLPFMVRKEHIIKTFEVWDLDEDYKEQLLLWTAFTKSKKLPSRPYQFISRLVNGTDQCSTGSVLSFDPETNMTYGFIAGLYTNDQLLDNADDLVIWEHEMFNTRMKASLMWSWHPVAHMIVQMEEMLRWMGLVARFSSVRVVETSHSAGLMQMTTKTSMVPLSEALARDYTSDTSALASQSVQMAMLQTALDTNAAILDRLMETIDEIESIAPYTRQIRPYLISEINNLRDRCRTTSTFTEGLQRHITFAQTAIYNLIAQRDSKLNLELARDSRMLAVASKRDSSSMKTIAVLTIAFLPGTFVSALFAMPLFNWEATSYADVTTDKLWVYWAVTIPMTLLIILAWFAWTKRQSWLKSKENKESMKAYDEADLEMAAMQADSESTPLNTDFQGNHEKTNMGVFQKSKYSWNKMFAKGKPKKVSID